ncbi:tetratricopeptide repeat protein [bacterium]|nr:tetratricopeptide repeat protein [bacterium]
MNLAARRALACMLTVLLPIAGGCGSAPRRNPPPKGGSGGQASAKPWGFTDGSAPQTASSKTADPDVEEAKEKCRARDWDGAILAAQRALDRDSENAQAHYVRGYALVQKGDVDGALPALARSAALKPDFAFSHGWLGKCKSTKGDADGALLELTTAIDLMSPAESPSWLLERARVKGQQKGDFEGALSDCSKVLRMKPEDAAAHSWRAWCEEQLHDLDAAIADHTETIRLSPESVHAYARRAGLHFMRGELDAALADCESGLALKSTSEPRETAELRWCRASIRRERGDQDGALADESEAVRLAPDFADGSFGFMFSTEPRSAPTVLKVQRGMAAALGGLMAGDVVIACDGKPVASPTSFLELKKGLKPGGRATIRVRRGSEELDLEIVARRRPVLPDVERAEPANPASR